MPAPVLVAGDLLVDVVAVVDGPLRVGSDTAASVRTGGGGSAANTAAWLARAGVPVALLAASGDDALGAAARAELADGGVELVGPVRPDAATGTCVVLVDPSGERTMLPDRAANDRLGEADVDAALARTGRPARVHLSGYTLLSPGSRPAGLALLRRARAEGVPTSVDAASAGPLGDVGADAFLAWVDGTDLLLANGEELDALGGEAAVLAAARSLVVKRGAAGATWTDGARRAQVPAAPAPVSDTTGAGDAFAAGLLASLVAGGDVVVALARGAALAAEAVAKVGARPD